MNFLTENILRLKRRKGIRYAGTGTAQSDNRCIKTDDDNV